MALGALSLSTTQGVRRRPFQATINGLTTGNVRIIEQSSPAFSIVNGKLRSERLPDGPVATVTIREYEPGVGSGYRDTTLDITVATQDALLAQATGLIGGGRSLRSWRDDYTALANGEFAYRVLANDDLGAMLAASAGGGTPTPTPTLRHVASRGHIPSVATGSTKVMSQVAFVWASSGTSVQLDIPTFYCANSAASDTIAPNNITWHASIEYPAGVFHEVLWGGATTKTTTGGTDWHTGLSDALSFNRVAGESAKLLVFADGPSGQIPLAQGSSSIRWTAGGDASVVSGATATDQVMTGGVVDGGVGAFIFGAIVDTSSVATVAAIGDSTTAGTGYTPDSTTGQTGEVALMFGNAYGLYNIGVGGTTLQNFNKGGTYRRTWANLYCSHIVNHYGKNDFTSTVGNRAADQIIGDFDIFGLSFPEKVIIGATIGPVTDSGNTTPNANSAARATVNSTIVGGRVRYSGAFLDLGAFMEDGTTGLWKTGYTTDGLHADATAQAAQIATPPFDAAAVAARTLAPNTFTPLGYKTNKIPVLILAGNPAIVSSTPAGTLNSAGSRPSYVPTASPAWGATAFSGAPGVTLDGSTQFFTGESTHARPWSNAAPAITLAALFFPTSTPAGDRPVWGCTTASPSNDRAAIYVNSSNKIVLKARRLDADATVTATSTATVANNTPCLVVAIFDPTSGTITAYINGVADAGLTAAFASTGSFSATNSADMKIGSISTTYTAMTFNLLYASDKALTTSELQKLEGYIAWQAGMAASLLPADHLYRSAEPVTL